MLARKAALPLLVVLAVTLLGVPSSSAALRARVAPAANVKSGSWSMVLTTPASAAPAGAVGPVSYVNTDVAGLSKPMFLTVTNTGTITLGARSKVWYLISSKSSTNLTLLTNARISACTGGVWNETLGTCSGTVRLLAVDDGTMRQAAPGTFPAAPGGMMRLKVEQDGVLAVGTRLTMGVRTVW